MAPFLVAFLYRTNTRSCFNCVLYVIKHFLILVSKKRSGVSEFPYGVSHLLRFDPIRANGNKCLSTLRCILQVISTLQKETRKQIIPKKNFPDVLSGKRAHWSAMRKRTTVGTRVSCNFFYENGKIVLSQSISQLFFADPKTTCRKCRFSRFVEVLELAREPSPTCEDVSHPFNSKCSE